MPVDIVDQLVAALSRHTKVARVWLFGSRARGDHRPRSDIDIAVEAPGASALDWDEVSAAVEALPTLLKIDLVRWENASDELQSRILVEGKRLYG